MMRERARCHSGALVVLALVVLASVFDPTPSASGQEHGRDPGVEAGTVVEGKTGARLDEAIRRFLPDPGFCGAVLVAAKGTILLEKGYGLADARAGKSMPADALFDWASTSKQFTAAALLKLQDQKKLKLDDPLSKHFQGTPKDKAKVTLRQLLNHTSGLEKGFRPEWRYDKSRRESFEEMYLAVPVASQPGRAFEYNNSAYALAAAVVERVSGRRFEEYCRDELFEPAGMKSATFVGGKDCDVARVPRADRGVGFTDRPYRFFYGDELDWGYRGCGGAVATVRDMYLWDRALRGRKVLSAAALKEFYAPGLEGYALGWYVDGTRGKRVEHSGDVRGFHCAYFRYLDADLCIAINGNYEPADRERDGPRALALRLAEILLD